MKNKTVYMCCASNVKLNGERRKIYFMIYLLKKRKKKFFSKNSERPVCLFNQIVHLLIDFLV